MVLVSPLPLSAFLTFSPSMACIALTKRHQRVFILGKKERKDKERADR